VPSLLTTHSAHFLDRILCREKTFLEDELLFLRNPREKLNDLSGQESKETNARILSCLVSYDKLGRVHCMAWSCSCDPEIESLLLLLLFALLFTTE